MTDAVIVQTPAAARKAWGWMVTAFVVALLGGAGLPALVARPREPQASLATSLRQLEAVNTEIARDVQALAQAGTAAERDRLETELAASHERRRVQLERIQDAPCYAPVTLTCDLRDPLCGIH